MLPQPSLTRIDDVTHVIQLAVAPVFLLTAVGTLLAVLTNRLGRAVDRARVLERRLIDSSEPAGERTDAHAELRVIARRIRLIYPAIALAVLCALLICLLIVVAFVDAFLAMNLSRVLGALFVAAMLALIASLLVFLREIFLAVNFTRQTIPLKQAPPA